MLYMVLPIFISIGLVLACIPQALSMCFGSKPLRQSKIDQKIDAQQSILANFKSYVGNSLNYFTTILDLASPLLTTSQEQRKKRRKRRHHQQCLLVSAILLAPLTTAQYAQTTTFKKDNYLATYARFLEEHPPWDNVPQLRKTWSNNALLPGLHQGKYLDPDNVIPTAEWVNPTTSRWNVAAGLLPEIPALPDLQISDIFADDGINDLILLLTATTQ